jgi:hypothetical protein
MAEVVGFLRDDATAGEKGVLKLLHDNLPKEFSVYVETPLHKKRDIRYPDFIVLTNYGVVVMEVKDWVRVEGRATPHGVTVRTREGNTHPEGNPVQKARDFAIVLSNELNSKRNRGQAGEAIPWSYAAVLYNLPTSVITQFRTSWGDEFVFGKSDLENPNILLDRIKKTFPVPRLRTLSKDELSLIRATIYPVVEIDFPGQEPFVLDEQQEKIVAEPVRQVVEELSKKAIQKEQAKRQTQLFAEIKTTPSKDALPVKGERISKDVSIRLVRGFSGSGKTLVLMQRAKFLAAQYPEWKIAVLTFNKPLQTQLEASFIGTNIQAKTFHSLCKQLSQINDDKPTILKDWLEEKQKSFPAITGLGIKEIEEELNFIRDLGVTKRETYFSLERKGAGKRGRLNVGQRNKVFDVLEGYRTALEKSGGWDFEELPFLALKTLDLIAKPPVFFDALLVDEAQDWAPVWFKVINRLIAPAHGLLFLADDPSQSIYRNFSWREKEVEVVGRTRWLRVPYRNTYEIYQAAYSLIANHAEIQDALREEGELIKPEINPVEMRHGVRPLIQKFSNSHEELVRVKNLVDLLKADGYREDQIAVLSRFRNDVEPLKNVLKGYNVMVHPIHSFKGLEMEAVIIPYIHRTFLKDEDETSERRLIYMAMSRARSRLYLTYSGKLPREYNDLRIQNLADFLG